MAKFILPKNPGTCVVLAGGPWYIVSNNQGGKQSIYIPCKTREEAERLRDRINSGDHNGEINIPKHVYHVR
jgi:hypothetical protein